MRKIDAVLLSALIIYDYSAQSLADSENVNLGHSFTSEYKQESSWLDSISIASVETADNKEKQVYRGVTRISPKPAEVKVDNTISYYELANLNTETTEAAVTNADVIREPDVQISIPVVKNMEAAIAAPETDAVMEEAAVSSPLFETVQVNNKLAADLTQLDSDNDGVFDYEDKCNGTVGVARFEGCPVPDSDNDGVNDEEDRCPYQAGNLENGGCPVVETTPINAEVVANAVTETPASGNYQNLVSFNFNDATLSNTDFNILLQFADVLIRNSDIKLEITHFNKQQDNVKMIVDYLKELGVTKDQMTVTAKQAEATDELKDKINIRLVK